MRKTKIPRFLPVIPLIVGLILPQVGSATATSTRQAPGSYQATGYRAISGTGDETCAIRVDGTLWCGDSGYARGGLTQEPSRDSSWVSVSTARHHTCAVTAAGAGYCWGDNSRGQLGFGGISNQVALPNPVAGNFSANGGPWARISAGDRASCGIKIDRTLWCWGENRKGQLGINSTTTSSSLPTREATLGADWRTVVNAGSTTCATRLDGSLWCWGANDFGVLDQVAAGTVVRQPIKVDSAVGAWAQVSIGLNHACGTSTSGSLWCWGRNDGGQLGIGSRSDRARPTLVSGGDAQWAEVKVGDIHTCAIRADRSAWCWGDNTDGQLGLGGRGASLLPAEVSGGQEWAQLSVSTDATCGIIAAGSAYCWGTEDSRTPQLVQPVYKSIELGYSHACAIDKYERPWCWGANESGMLGLGDVFPHYSPIALGRSFYEYQFKSVSLGAGHTCGTDRFGSAICWGDSPATGGGLASDQAPNPPRFVAGLDPVKTIAAGKDTSCGLTRSGKAFCWGASQSGLLGPIGPGGGVYKELPWPVPGGLTFASLSHRSATACGITARGKAYCWGNNRDGQLGNGTTVRVTSPKLVGGNHTWATISVGGNHTCGLTTAGQSLCWGGNQYGQLGDGTTISRTLPTRVVDSASWLSLSPSLSASTCGIKTDQKVYCWGLNEDGQLGRSQPSGTAIPLVVPGLQAKKVSTGSFFACALSADSSIRCWGKGESGQLGNGSGVDRPSPTLIP